MTMSAEQFRRADILFQAACALPAEDRLAFVEEACADDRSLRSQVLHLLRHDERPSVDFETAIGSTLRAVSEELLREPQGPVPFRIGAYRILRQIGEGGFGTVYLAEQENPRRTVALKVIRAFMSTPEAVKRFEHEIHVLGRLQHPGIAQIFEAGVAEAVFDSAAAPSRPVSLPYYTMEYIQGLDLIQFAENPGGEEGPLGVSARLELIARVCDALQHAHQNGFIHRDLKPDNILVIRSSTRARSGSTTGLGAQPKLLDFGVARALDDEDDADRSFTTKVGQLVGTPAYMSPEQVRGDPRRVDTRADVYAVGVILYQLLAGRLPYDVGRATMVDAARIIESADPPPLRSKSRTRSVRIDADVDAIVSKALAKDPGRRYQSAADLAFDIRRYLAGEPIEAKRDSALYLLRKSARRYRGALSAAAAFCLMLAGFSVWSVHQARVSERLAKEADMARGEALVERDRANETADRLASEISLSNIARGRAVGQTGNHVAAENLIWGEFLAHPDSIEAKWALMEHYSRFSNIASLPADVDEITDVALNPDETIIAVVGRAPRVELWDAESYSRIAVLEGHEGGVNEACFSPDGHVLATAGEDGRIILWDVQARTMSREFKAGRGRATSVRFDATGRLLVTGGTDRIVRVHNARTLACLAESSPHPREVVCVSLSDDNRYLASGSNDFKARLWNFREMTAGFDLDSEDSSEAPLIQPFPEPLVLSGHADGVRELSFSHDGSALAGVTASRDRRIMIWNTADGSVGHSLHQPTGMPTAVAFSPDDATLHVGGWFSIDSWNLAAGERIRHLQTDRCSALKLTRDGGRLVGVARRDIRIWETAGNNGVLRIDDPPGRAIAFHPNGRLIATGHGFADIHLRDIDSGETLKVISAPPDESLRGSMRPVKCAAFDPTGEHVAILSVGPAIRVFNVASGSVIATYRGVEGETSQCMEFDPVTPRLGMSANGSKFLFEDIHDPNDRITLPAGGRQALALAFSGDGRMIATTTRAKSIQLWRHDGTAVGEIELPHVPWGVALNMDGTRVAAGTWGNTIEVWNLETMTHESSLEGHFTTVWTVSFKPDDPTLLASGSSDGTLRIWDVTTGANLAAFEPSPGEGVDFVRFSPDGRRIAASCAGGKIRILDLSELERCIERNVRFRRARAQEPVSQ